MRVVAVAVLLAGLATLAWSQTVQHVIVVIQENRSTDNLFGADADLIARGANLWDISKPVPCVFNGKSEPTLLQPWALDSCFDPLHVHAAWMTAYDQGKMDGACNNHPSDADCVPQLKFPNYSYIDNSRQMVTPYFNIAANYGFANYMFQTNQGPSFAAHQFLFSGTSAPVSDDGDPQMYWQWFAENNPANSASAGCVSPLSQVETEIDPQGNESSGYTPPYPAGAGPGFPCYTHNTLATLLDNAGVSWKYYSSAPYLIWTAPAAISGICGAVVKGNCTAAEWRTHIVVTSKTNPSPFLTDIQNCNLPAVSWVIPDGKWSDHPGDTGDDGGPSWVSAIVNGIGGDVRNAPGCGYWANTVILITWDDWGGWYDHVSPAAAAGGPGIGYPNQTGAQYVYGFRVPLLVVSAYAKPSYISGPASNPDCSHGNYYCHDFGSILNFIEHTFNLGASGINPAYAYADTLAPDSPQIFSASPYSLADFFGTQFHPFVPITGAKYPPGCFMNSAEHCFTSPEPRDPDKDAVDDQD